MSKVNHPPNPISLDDQLFQYFKENHPFFIDAIGTVNFGVLVEEALSFIRAHPTPDQSLHDLASRLGKVRELSYTACDHPGIPRLLTEVIDALHAHATPDRDGLIEKLEDARLPRTRLSNADFNAGVNAAIEIVRHHKSAQQTSSVCIRSGEDVNKPCESSAMGGARSSDQTTVAPANPWDTDYPHRGDCDGRLPECSCVRWREIPVVGEDVEREVSFAISAGISLVGAGWTIDAAVKTTLERIRPYLRTAEQERWCPSCGGNDADHPCAYPGENKRGCMRDERLCTSEPVSRNDAPWPRPQDDDDSLPKTHQPVSLEKCAFALKVKWLGTHDIGANPGIGWLELAKVVLDAAGVKHVS